MRFALAFLIMIILVGCTSVKQAEQPNTSAPGDVKVKMMDYAFLPGSITIQQGTTVTWTNEDSASHSVVFADFQSPLLSTGETFSHTFDATGEYSYSCSIHPSMTGTVIVIA
jgi:plastocyanin